MLPIPQPLWGQWLPGERLYASGATEVYALTRAQGTARSCVVKCVRIPAGRPELLEAAREQCRVQQRMADSGHAVQILDDCVLPDGGGTLVLLRMERLDCLQELLRQGAGFSDGEILQLAKDLLQALVFAARMNVVHRDIKPANIYRTPSGVYQLGDFGIASRADAPAPFTGGTAAYLAPETAGGKPADARSDLYALGVVLYQLLNGGFLPLTDGASSYTDIEHTISARLRGRKLPPLRRGCRALRRAVMRACEPDPRRRWQSAAQMLRALTQPERPVWPAVLACGACLAAGLLAGRLLPGRTPAQPPSSAQEPSAAAGMPQEPAAEHRYEFVAQALSWDEARIWCEARGGHLAVVTSAEESEQIKTLLAEHGASAAWLGANKLNAANGFQWVTGEPFSYAEWGPGEPNNTNNAEHYLMVMDTAPQGYVWNDSRLNGMEMFAGTVCGFLCEWEAPAP